MNEFQKMQRIAQVNKNIYPSGTKILLLSMGDDSCPIENNTRGTVDIVDDISHLKKRACAGRPI